MARKSLGKVTLERWKLTCDRCGHEWHVLGTPPPKCAACRSEYWDHPRGTLKMGRPRKKK